MTEFLPSPDVLKAQGNEAFKVKDYEQAISLWRSALSLYPEPSEACIRLHSNIAAALLSIGDHQGCCVEATAGLDCGGLRGSVLRGKLLARRAEACDHLGKWEEALHDYTEAIMAKLDASSITACREKANSLYHRIFGGPAYPFQEQEDSKETFPPNQRRQALVFRPRPHPATSASPPSRIYMTHWSHGDNLYCWGGKRLYDHEILDSQTLFVYSAVTGEWKEVLPTSAGGGLPNPRCAAAAAVWRGHCYMHSGKPRRGSLPNKRYSKWGMLSVWQLDLSTFKWNEYWKPTPKELKKGKKLRLHESPACAVTESGKFLEWGGDELDAVSGLEFQRPVNSLRIFDIPSKTWSVVHGSQAADGRPLPTPRQTAVGWVHGDHFYVFGGHGAVEGAFNNLNTRAFNDLDRFNLERRVWESIPLMGDYPPPLQEAGYAAICSPEMATKLPDGRLAVFIFGGFIMVPQAPYVPLQSYYGLDPRRWPPEQLLPTYQRDHYRLDLRTLHWSRLHQVGNRRPLKNAQARAFLPASAPHRLVFTLGYGFHPVETTPLEPTLVDGQLLAGGEPVCFDTTYDAYPSACPLAGKGDLFPVSGTATDPATGGLLLRARHPHFEVGEMTTPAWGVNLADEQEQCEREQGYQSDGKMPRIYVWHIKSVAPGDDRFDMIHDTYCGPSAKVMAELASAGLNLRRYAPPAYPPGTEDYIVDRSKGTHENMDVLLAAWIQKREARQQRLGEALLATYRARSAARAASGRPRGGLVLLVQLHTIVPRVWRRVRVGARVTLRELHDLVLCPALGWERAYHSYAFRELRAGERHDADSVVWFGNPGQGDDRTVDMIHVPFFYGGALVKDKGVLVDSMFEEEGSRLAYVYDLGHYWWHSITLESYCKEDSVALLDGWGQAVPEDVDGGSWKYPGILRNLLPDPPLHPQEKAFSTNQWWIRYWDLLNGRNNVGTPGTFDPCHFDLELHRKRLAMALGSRVSRYDGGHNLVPSTTLGQGAVNGTITREELRINEPLKEARQRCAVCGAGAGLNRCAGCGLVHYCGREHQKGHWKEHKVACKAAQKKKAKDTEARGTVDDNLPKDEKPVRSPSTPGVSPPEVRPGSSNKVLPEEVEEKTKKGNKVSTEEVDIPNTSNNNTTRLAADDKEEDHSGVDCNILDDCWDEMGL